MCYRCQQLQLQTSQSSSKVRSEKILRSAPLTHSPLFVFEQPQSVLLLAIIFRPAILNAAHHQLLSFRK